MKVRQGFVSNSSSSSFVCDITGETVEGWDYCLSEAGMVECENGHVFLEEYVLWSDSIRLDIIKNYTDYDFDDITSAEDALSELEDFRYSMPHCMCPICSMEIIIDADIDSYASKKYNISRESALEWVKSKNKRRKKLRAGELTAMTLEIHPTTVDDMCAEIRSFGSYKAFKNYLRSN